MQTLVTLPVSMTLTSSQVLHRPSTQATLLKIYRPSAETSRSSKEISYGDVSLDEVIEIPKFDLTTITIE